MSAVRHACLMLIVVANVFVCVKQLIAIVVADVVVFAVRCRSHHGSIL